MRPRILHSLSRHLAIALEEGIRGGVGEVPIPVYLCHPLDLADAPLSPTESFPERGASDGRGRVGRSSGRAVGALYLSRVAPDARFRQAGSFAEPPLGPALPAHVRRFGFWVRLRFVFMVVGGSNEEELGALAGALQALSATPFVSVDEILGVDAESRTERSTSVESGDEREGVSKEVDVFPLEIIEDDSIWRELGMEEHRLAVVFHVSVPLAAPQADPVGKVVDRELALTPADVEAPAKADRGGGGRATGVST